MDEWWQAFALTVAVEWIVAVPLLGRAHRPRRGAVVLFAQLATHPIVWFVLPALGLPRLPYLIVAEAFAIVAEAAVYHRAFQELGLRRPLAVSSLANGASLGIGSLLR